MLRLSKAIGRQVKLVRKFSSVADPALGSQNAIYVEQMYSKWQQDRKSVHTSWDAFFGSQGEAGLQGLEANKAAAHQPSARTIPKGKLSDIVAQEKLAQMVYRYRKRAHEVASIDPLDLASHKFKYAFPFVPVEDSPEQYGFTPEELDQPIEFFMAAKGFHNEKKTWTPREASEYLRHVYMDKIGFEYIHIPSNEVQDWIREKIEHVPMVKFNKSEKEYLLDRIIDSQAFTDFCERKYSSAKRFGIDGLDSAVSGLEKLVDTAKEQGATNVVVGMAHRGRLNTLACVFDKPYEAIFTEFKDPGIDKAAKSSIFNFSGDVKYHLGASQKRYYKDGSHISLTMLPNPSHLETVNTIALGKAKAKMDFLGDEEGTKVVPVLIHGDAAFSGQGIVFETLQMERLKGYSNGGTIHVIFNNHIGFTTNPDVMKTNDSFILHVNADYPEHVDFAFKLAVEYRMKFKRDVVIDVSGYRKYGHNEQDAPKFTQPLVYDKVAEKTPMWKMYTKQLVEEGHFTQAEIDTKYQRCIDNLEKAFTAAKDQNFDVKDWDSSTWKSVLTIPQDSAEYDPNSPVTAISQKDFKTIGRLINTLPENKEFHPIINKVYDLRLKSIETGEGVDWASAEALAFATLLQEGFGVRLSGEDVRRGTFSHRHAVILDQKDFSQYTPILASLDEESKSKLQVYNSFLSEYGVLGFEYGYSTGNPNFLTIWEAQFGDFVNVAQPVTDLYIAGGERKWGVKTGLVMLLPHGFDGQGPEHSSARLERFLQMMDDDPFNEEFMKQDPAKQAVLSNMLVCNITDPANYFHVLRRQLHLSGNRKPLIMMSPKKLLRLKDAKSPMSAFTETKHFRRVIPEVSPQSLDAPEKIKQVIFCSGQVYYDLVDKRTELGAKHTAIVRLEQIAPLPYEQVLEQINKYPNAQITWAQEEHRNQGPFTYFRQRTEHLLRIYNIKSKIRYVGRHISGSTAVGSLNTHKQQLAALLEDAFKLQ